MSSKVKFMTLAQLERIRKDPYYRGAGGEGLDYEDIKDLIDARYHELKERQAEKEFQKRMREERDYEDYQRSNKEKIREN